MSLTIKSAAGIALLAVIAAGCGTAAATHSAGTQPKPASPTVAATHPAAGPASSTGWSDDGGGG